jgi:transposase
MASKRRTYTPEFQQEAVRLVREEGLTYAKVGDDLGVNKTVIRDWCKKAEAGSAPSQKRGGTQMSVEEELAKLRRENRILREEREILKKAAAFFAKETR